MNDPESNPSPNDLDAYLDGLLSPRERQEFARRAANDSSLKAQIQLQQLIDRQLQSQFQIPPVPVLDVLNRPSQPINKEACNGTRQPLPSHPAQNTVVVRPTPPPSPPAAPPRRSLLNLGKVSSARWQIAGLVTMATVAWIAVVWHLLPSSRNRVVFAERPLAEVYDETVAFGFEPYYVCDEDERFRATFYFRHGQALKLGDLPAGRQMVGLSYLPAISRHTTAMLATVEGREVMVFVDKRTRDRRIEPPSAESGLRMFRRELNDLVMYEVTPFAEPLVMSFLRLAEPPPDACPIE
jgi:hypothetical protein